MRRSPILVGVDGSFAAETATTWAACEAASREAPLVLLYAHRGDHGAHDGESEADFLRRAALLADQAAPGIEVSAESVRARASKLLTSRSDHAEMIVLGERRQSRGRGSLIGSLALGLVSHAHCPVVVVRGDDAGWTDGDIDAHDAPVVVGLDGSPQSDAALGFAYEFAALHRAPLVTAHTWTDHTFDLSSPLLVDVEAIQRDEQRVLAEQLAGWREKYPDVVVERLVSFDRSARALLVQGKRARLLVVGARGRGGVSGMLLGSTSQALLRRARCPVAVVRDPQRFSG